jgi:hypothetical protein
MLTAQRSLLKSNILITGQLGELEPHICLRLACWHVKVDFEETHRAVALALSTVCSPGSEQLPSMQMLIPGLTKFALSDGHG